MKRRLTALVAATALAVIGLAGTAAAGDNGNKGQQIGQDPLRLALTQCSNAGGGNGGEFEAAVVRRSVLSDCLEKRLLSRYSAEEVAAIIAQSNCIGPFPLAGVCEVDPGNSAAHNQAGL